jgi:hypothetical protein
MAGRVKGGIIPGSGVLNRGKDGEQPTMRFWRSSALGADSVDSLQRLPEEDNKQVKRERATNGLWKGPKDGGGQSDVSLAGGAK